MNKESELCNKIDKECGYLNFTNDVLDLMKKFNITCVASLEEHLKASEIILKKICICEIKNLQETKFYLNANEELAENEYKTINKIL